MEVHSQTNVLFHDIVIATGSAFATTGLDGSAKHRSASRLMWSLTMTIS